MKLIHTSILLLAIAAFLSGSAAMGQVHTEVNAQSESTSEAPDTLLASFGLEVAEAISAEAVRVVAEEGRGRKSSKRNRLSSTGREGLACEEFEISCSNGTTDDCCGSVLSCGIYCSEICGGPCIYEGDE